MMNLGNDSRFTTNSEMIMHLIIYSDFKQKVNIVMYRMENAMIGNM